MGIRDHPEDWGKSTVPTLSQGHGRRTGWTTRPPSHPTTFQSDSEVPTLDVSPTGDIPTPLSSDEDADWASHRAQSHSTLLSVVTSALLLGGLISAAEAGDWEDLKTVSPWMISDVVSLIHVHNQPSSGGTSWASTLRASTFAAAATYFIAGPSWGTPCAFGLTFGMSEFRSRLDGDRRGRQTPYSGSETANTGSGWREILGRVGEQRLSDAELV